MTFATDDEAQSMTNDELLAQINGHDPYDVEFVRRFRELEVERDKLREALRPFAATLERYSGFTEYALFGVWEDVNGAAGRKLNILRKQDFDNARAALRDLIEGGRPMSDNKRQTELNTAFLKAIETIGVDQLKKSSIFIRNVDDNGCWDAALAETEAPK